MPYLVDTDVLIDVSRNNEAAIDFLEQLDDSWSLSIITALELIVGARNKKEVTQIDQLVAVYSAIPLTADIGRHPMPYLASLLNRTACASLIL